MKGKKIIVQNTDCIIYDVGMNKLAIMLSGTGYTYEKPYLYYCTQIAIQKGYDVLQIHYSFLPSLFQQSEEIISQTIYEKVKGIIDIYFKDHEYDRLLFIGKSLGTIPIVNHFMQQTIPLPIQFVNLTPLLSMDSYFDNLLKSPSSSFIVIGTADGNYDSEKVQALTQHQVFIIENANHSLDILGDTQKSMKALSNVIEGIQNYID